MDYYSKYLKYKQKYLNLKQMNGGNQPQCPRYIIFAGPYYYAEGGWGDYFDVADTLAEAKRSYKNALQVQLIDWAHVVDMTTKTIIIDSLSKV